MTRASLELIDSAVFLTFFWATIFNVSTRNSRESKNLKNRAFEHAGSRGEKGSGKDFLVRADVVHRCLKVTLESVRTDFIHEILNCKTILCDFTSFEETQKIFVMVGHHFLDSKARTDFRN